MNYHNQEWAEWAKLHPEWSVVIGVVLLLLLCGVVYSFFRMKGNLRIRE